VTEKLKTIANFSEPFEAHLAKARLDSCGIECVLVGENFVATYWFASLADRGIKLQVRESDADRAGEILAAAPQKTGEDNLVEEAESLPTDLKCPKCGSAEVEYEKFSRKAFFLSILFLGFPLSFLKRSCRCSNCGHVWK